MFLIPYLGETIDESWDLLTLEVKLYCAENIIRSAEQQNVNDIKIPNTLMLFVQKNVSPKISLIDGNDEKIVYTYTPYTEPHKNRKGRLSGLKTEENIQFQKETISDLENLLRYIKSIQPENDQNSATIKKFNRACKKFISNLKYSELILELFLKLDIQRIEDQLLSAIRELKTKIARYEYLATPASEQEVTEARIFSLSVMFWQLLNKERVLNIKSSNKIFPFYSDKITPELCRQERQDWCLHENGRDETPLTEIVLKGYEKKLSYNELLEAVCEELRKMH
jgi:hypothetical protein